MFVALTYTVTIFFHHQIAQNPHHIFSKNLYIELKESCGQRQKKGSLDWRCHISEREYFHKNIDEETESPEISN